MKAIITDLDGTILPSGGTISPQTLHALQTVGNRSIVRIVATGRTLFAARKFLTDDFPIDYLVFSSGAGIMEWKNKKILQAHHLSKEETQELATYLWEYNINFIVQQEIPDNHYFYYTDIYPAHRDYLRRLEKFRDYGTLISNPEEIRTPATQLIMILNDRQLALVEKIKQDLPRYSVIRSTSPLDNQAVWLEIYPSCVNKGYSCQYLLNFLKIATTDCAGIGNDYNDTDFLDICGKAYLVKNAPSPLLPHYRTVASVIQEGFSEFIAQIL